MVREFVVRAGCEQSFRLIFGPGGMWDSLLRLGSTGYQGCQLISIGPRSFELWDYWTSHVEFEAFRDWCQPDVGSFSAWLSSMELLEQRKLLGMFYEGDVDRGPDESGMVPA